MKTKMVLKANDGGVLLILTIIGLVIMSVTLGAQIYQNRYSQRNIDGGITTPPIKYGKSRPSTYIAQVEPTKGQLVFGLCQTQGTQSNTYKVEYKELNSKKYVTPPLKNGYSFGRNNTYYGSWKICKTDGYKDYHFRFTRLDKNPNSSTITADIMLDE